MSSCKTLNEIKKRIESGVPADDAIPWEVPVETEDDYIEILYYAKQVLPEGRRKDDVARKLEELTNVRRTESKL